MASEAKFTPGPWHLSGPDDFGDFTIQGPHEALAIAGVVNGNMHEICGTSDEQAANAALIAAAPTMFSALEDIASTPCCETPGCCFEDPMCDAMIARAALAKANGEQE